MTKIRAFIVHLVLSCVILAVVLGVMLFFWYPGIYFSVDGGWTVLRILIGVDLVLGPLLTLIVFKPGKPGLRFDLACIALLQCGALIYGGLTIYQQRPEFLVFAVDRFNTVARADVEWDKLRYPELQQPPAERGPRLALAQLPTDQKARTDLLFESLGGGKDIEQMAEYYHPYWPDIAELRRRSVDIHTIVNSDQQAKQALDAFIADHGGGLDDYFYFPLMGKNKDVLMVLSNRDGQPVGLVDIDPWPSSYRTAAASS